MFMTLADGAHSFGSIIAGWRLFFLSLAAIFTHKNCNPQNGNVSSWQCVCENLQSEYLCDIVYTEDLCRFVSFIWFGGASSFAADISYFVAISFSVVVVCFFRFSCCLFVISVRYFSSWINACNNITSEYLSGHLIIILFYFSCLIFSSIVVVCVVQSFTIISFVCVSKNQRPTIDNNNSSATKKFMEYTHICPSLAVSFYAFIVHGSCIVLVPSAKRDQSKPKDTKSKQNNN